MHREEVVVVVGAGIAGVACARELADAGVAVRLLDRGARLGGRMASRRLDDRPVDLGASYFTVGDDAFRTVVDDWRVRGLAHPWTDTFLALSSTREPEVKQGPVRWGAPGGLRFLVEDLARPLDDGRVSEQDVHEVRRDDDGLWVDLERVRAVVLAMPDPQARRLVGAGLDDVRAALERRWEPAFAVAARWPTRTWDGVAPSGRFDGAFVSGDDVIAWVADDGRRRGDDAPVLVAHSTPDFAAPLLAGDPAVAGPPMVAALRRLLGIGADPEETFCHRWSFAKPDGERAEPFWLGGGQTPVGVCGDGWGETSKVETAFCSGRALGRALVARLAPGTVLA